MFDCTKRPAILFTVCLCVVGVFFSSVMKFSEAYTFRSCYPYVRDPTSIFCQNQGIRYLDAISDLLNDTKALNLSKNHLYNLPAMAFSSLPALEQLRLDLNHILYINAAAFHGLSSLRLLNLSGNSLSEFPLGAAESLTSLNHLILSSNRLTTLCGQGFLHSLSLQYLDISLNQLDCGNMSCLANLTSLVTLRAHNVRKKCPESPFSLPLTLRQLDLSDNKLSKFPLSTSGVLISIRMVDLSWNKFSSPEALANLSPSFLDLRHNDINVTKLLLDLSWAPKLQSISISLHSKSSASVRAICMALACRRTASLQLTDIHDDGIQGDFQDCSSLYHLDVSGNKIQTPSLFVCQESLWTLRSLIMDRNHIKSLQFCIGPNGNVELPNLTSLSLRSNHIYRVLTKSFYGMPKLKFLSLAQNRIAYIERMSFFGLGQLEELELSGNAISVLYNATFQNLSNLTVLKLRNNLLKRLYAGILSLPNLQKLDLGGNALEFIQDSSFEGLPNLRDLYLDRNKLKNVTSMMFLDLRLLQVLDLAGNNLRFSDGEKPFGRLTHLRSLKLERQLPYGIRTLPGNVFTGLGKLTELDLSSNKLYDLNKLPLSMLTNLTYLKMSDMCNGMANMPNSTFTNLSMLTTLILENFGLTQIQERSFRIRMLRDLVLTNNMLQTIPADFGNFLPQLLYLDVRFNPLACTCANEAFRLWALQSSVHVILFYKIKCPSTSIMDNKTELLADGQHEVCTDPTQRMAFAVSITAILATLVGGLGYGKGRWYFLYGYYMLRIWLKETQLRKARQKKYRYDAFVSYSSQDEEWVFTELVPHLESAVGATGDEGGGSGASGCHLCLHHRDFEPGKTIVSNIVEAIYSSRKTLCLVSPQYFNSEWCCMEVQVALYRLFDENNDLLVLVFLEAPPPWALSSFHKLHRVVRRRTYLEWPREACQQHVFWARLRLALQLPEREDPEDPALI